MKRLEGQAVLLVIPHDGFREEELDVTRQRLQAEGAEVRLASSSLAPAHGMAGQNAFPDLLYCAARAEDYRAVVFVGGSGAVEYYPDLAAHELAKATLRAGRVLGAICFGSSILAEAGLLEGRRATGFPTREAHLRERGASWTGEATCVDGGIVTGRGPDDARAFAEALVDALA